MHQSYSKHFKIKKDKTETQSNHLSDVGVIDFRKEMQICEQYLQKKRFKWSIQERKQNLVNF